MRGIVRRAIAVLAAALATGAIYWAVIRDPDQGGDRDRIAQRGDVSERVRELVGGLSPEQKVDGVMMIGFEGVDATAPVLDLLAERQLGGVMVGPDNWLDAAQGSALVAEMGATAAEGGDVPPLVAAAQEGGEYRALADLPPESRALDIGDHGDPELARSWAREAGEALREAGFDMNLAPVADVATLDSAIADRAFSDDPAIVAELTAAAVQGCAEARIACVARHFPGLGAASQSTDDGPANVSLDRATLAARDLVPFEAAIAEGVPAVMLSHAFYAAYDPVTPGSTSAEIADELLRDQLGFEGVAMTDDLGTGAIRATTGVRPAAVAAINAGADMVLVGSGEEASGVRAALLRAVSSREIDPERIDEAVGRVLEVKRSLGLLGTEGTVPAGSE